MGRLCYTQNVTAVTGACLLVKKSLYEKVGGLEESFVISLNDVDFCLKLRELGLLNVWTPFAELYHYESVSRGLDDQGEKAERYNKESGHFRLVVTDCQKFILGLLVKIIIIQPEIQFVHITHFPILLFYRYLYLSSVNAFRTYFTIDYLY